MYEILKDLVDPRKDTYSLVQKIEDNKFRDLIKLNLEARNRGEEVNERILDIYTSHDRSTEEFRYRYFALSILLLIKTKEGNPDVISDLEDDVWTEYKQLDRDKRSLIDHFVIAWCLDRIFHVYWYVGNLNKAKEAAEAAFNLYDEIGYDIFKYLLRTNIVEAFEATISSEELVEEYEEISRYYATHGYNQFELETKVLIVNEYQKQGRIDEALDLLDQIEEDIHTSTDYLIEKINFKRGTIYRLMGKYKKSIEVLNISLKQFQINWDDNLGYGRHYQELGYSYYLAGEIDQTEKFFSKSYQKLKQVGNRIDLLNLLYRMCIVYTELGQRNRAEDIFIQFKNLSREVNVIDFRSKMLYLQAIMKMNQEQALQKFIALEKFKTLIDHNLPFEIEINSRVKMCKLRLLEIKIIHDKSNIDTLQRDLDILIEMTVSKFLYSFFIDIIFLKAKLMIYCNKVEDAFRFIRKQKKQIDQWGMDHISTLYYENLNQIETQVNNTHVSIKSEEGQKVLFDKLLDRALSNFVYFDDI